MAAEDRIDLAYRPAARLFPLSLEHLLLARIKGSTRRRALRQAIEDGTVSELPSALVLSGLSEQDRREISRLHPMLMGGEHLPDLDDDEYGDDCLAQPTERCSRSPLTLGAFTRFVLRASALRGVLAMNAPYVRPQRFVHLDSRIYPKFEALVRARIDAWFPTEESDEPKDWRRG